eukprot:3296608-Rhodomonas_salina.2
MRVSMHPGGTAAWVWTYCRKIVDGSEVERRPIYNRRCVALTSLHRVGLQPCQQELVPCVRKSCAIQNVLVIVFKCDDRYSDLVANANCDASSRTIPSRNPARNVGVRGPFGGCAGKEVDIGDRGIIGGSEETPTDEHDSSSAGPSKDARYRPDSLHTRFESESQPVASHAVPATRTLPHRSCHPKLDPITVSAGDAAPRSGPFGNMRDAICGRSNEKALVKEAATALAETTTAHG